MRHHAETDCSIMSTDRWLRYEANCSPNPFDILAIYALYQTVNDSDDE